MSIMCDSINSFCTVHSALWVLPRFQGHRRGYVMWFTRCARVFAAAFAALAILLVTGIVEERLLSSLLLIRVISCMFFLAGLFDIFRSLTPPRLTSQAGETLFWIGVANGFLPACAMMGQPDWFVGHGIWVNWVISAGLIFHAIILYINNPREIA